MPANTLSHHLLVIDDDARLRDLVRRFLVKQGFIVTTAESAVHARDLLHGITPDALLIDVMMPDEDGFSFLSAVRAGKTAARSNVPVLMLTARDALDDRLQGLDSGADDYVTKPFEPQELVSRIRAVLRRTTDSIDVNTSESESAATLQIGCWTYTLGSTLLRNGDRTETLSDTEENVLRILAQSVGRAVSRFMIAEQCGLPMGLNAPESERAVDVRIARLRRRLGIDRYGRSPITTVRGVGYRLQAG